MNEQDRETLQAITTVRGSNNRLWMTLVEIALEYAPERTREVLKAINANDRQVSDLLGELAK